MVECVGRPRELIGDIPQFVGLQLFGPGDHSPMLSLCDEPTPVPVRTGREKWALPFVSCMRAPPWPTVLESAG